MASKRTKQTVLGTAALVAALVLVFALTDRPAVAPTQTDTNSPAPGQTIIHELRVSYRGVEGRTALELLKSGHRVETKSFGDLGEFVESIDGIAGGDTHFWAFYVNGQMATVGADSYVTKANDLIEWRLEKIE